MNNKIIGLNIKKYRKKAGFTQERLAELLDISTVHMSHMECGHVSMSIDILLKLCESLQVSPNQILSGVYNSPANTAEQNSLSLSKEQEVLFYKIMQLIKDYELSIESRFQEN